MSVRKITLLSLLTTLVYVGRTSFQFLPNVQPMTTILILITLILGLKDGIIVAILSLLLSNLSMGMGIWTIAQIVSFSFILLLVSIIGKIYKNIPKSVMALVCGFMGLVYGFIISLVQAPFFGWASFIPYYISGIPYDMYHAFGNYFFYLILAPALTPILLKNKNKLLGE